MKHTIQTHPKPECLEIDPDPDLDHQIEIRSEDEENAQRIDMDTAAKRIEGRRSGV